LLREVKFDGWRIQLHKHGGSAAAFTKNGRAHSSRVQWIIGAFARLPGLGSLAIDGELVACDHAGLRDFYALHFHRRRGLYVWAFDLLHHNGRDLRELPLLERKARLKKLKYRRIPKRSSADFSKLSAKSRQRCPAR
jgi:bifunctional non-homologous end joining protein LigD